MEMVVASLKRVERDWWRKLIFFSLLGQDSPASKLAMKMTRNFSGSDSQPLSSSPLTHNRVVFSARELIQQWRGDIELIRKKGLSTQNWSTSPLVYPGCPCQPSCTWRLDGSVGKWADKKTCVMWWIDGWHLRLCGIHCLKALGYGADLRRDKKIHLYLPGSLLHPTGFIRQHSVNLKSQDSNRTKTVDDKSYRYHDSRLLGMFILLWLRTFQRSCVPYNFQSWWKFKKIRDDDLIRIV